MELLRTTRNRGTKQSVVLEPKIPPKERVKKAKVKPVTEAIVTSLPIRKQTRLRMLKKVKKSTRRTNFLIEIRDNMIKEARLVCRVILGYYQVQTRSRCQMHAVNNALGKEHLVIEYMESYRLKRIKTFKKKFPQKSVPVLGSKDGMWDRGFFMDVTRASGIEIVRMRLGVDGKRTDLLLDKLNIEMKRHKKVSADGLRLILYLQYDTKPDTAVLTEVKHAVAVRMLPRANVQDTTDPHALHARNESAFPIDRYRVIDSDYRKEFPLAMYPLLSSVTSVYAVRLKSGV